MKKAQFFLVLFLSVMLFAGCIFNENGDNEPELIIEPPETAGIEGFSFDNLPRIDGSTSCRHLNTMIACKLLHRPYYWQEPAIMTEWQVFPVREALTDNEYAIFTERVKTSQTHGAFVNLIDGAADIILTHRTLSPDEAEYARSKGVSLIETPVAADAFVFVVNINNPVKSLTVNQVRQIYTGEITNWAQVGGQNAEMKVYTRPRNSGSEEVMRELVMGGLEMAEFSESSIGQMSWVFTEVIENDNAICYTFNNYKELIMRTYDAVVPRIAINGVFPDETTVKDETYPFISKVNVAVRSDLDHNSMAYRMFEWLQSANAKPVYEECGFVGMQ
ncbi:MAG: substrate-binding domain-containing protein [Dysgonamonadaceae bacterium]|jgi:phosphate transport system substrate-binding protein|nr:substrate-binding domain-containing protein [Dysgonamonadaceae bacterium]